MLRTGTARIFVQGAAAALLLAGLFFPQPAKAQEDGNETPLGDVARNLRKKNPPSSSVIDDDNFTQVMEQAEGQRGASQKLKFLMTGEAKGFQVSAPDATCSLAFTANAKTLLSSQYAQLELPASETEKLTGPATIEGDALTVSVLNGTDWHVSEVAVALTIVKKVNAAESPSGAMKPVGGKDAFDSLVRPEKNSDRTMIYRMREAAPPSSTTVFSAPLNMDIAPGDEWHWAIVEAKGYPPESYSAHAEQNPSNGVAPAMKPVALSPALLAPMNQAADSLRQDPQ
jgi:hypothetical protein